MSAFPTLFGERLPDPRPAISGGAVLYGFPAVDLLPAAATVPGRSYGSNISTPRVNRFVNRSLLDAVPRNSLLSLAFKSNFMCIR